MPHTYRCLLPESDGLSIADYQTQLSAALLRLSTKAVHHICEINRELISRLRNHDYAFSSARVTFNHVPEVIEALESLANRKSSSGDASSTSGREVGGGEEDEGLPPTILHAQLQCLRFGLITPGTDVTEMIQLVLRMANAVEEDSNVS